MFFLECEIKVIADDLSLARQSEITVLPEKKNSLHGCEKVNTKAEQCLAGMTASKRTASTCLLSTLLPPPIVACQFQQWSPLTFTLLKNPKTHVTLLKKLQRFLLHTEQSWLIVFH
jgi:hypothetical protein